MWFYLAIILFVALFFIKSFEPFEEKKKGILVLHGESFRKGTIGSRERDCDECVETQKIASKSHNDFIDYVEKKYNLTMDVLINTYDTKYEKELKSYYKNPQFYSHPELLGFHGIAQEAVNRIDTSQYDFILLTRPDIFIKPQFNQEFDPSWNKLCYLSPTEYDPRIRTLNNKQGIYYPDVNPTFIFIPKKYFYTLSHVYSDHPGWNHYMETYQLTEKDLGFMNNYAYNPDSGKISNPYYKMIGRTESTVLMDKNQVLDTRLIGIKLTDL
jgi:hypothetical protein